MLHTPYRVACRFFRDSDELNDVVWYKCRDDAPTLPFPSMVCSRFWDYEFQFQPPGGEEPYAKFTNQRGPAKPAAVGTHQCGTAEDFAEGCLRDTTLPPVVYRANGLPACCAAVVDGRGGGAGGGRDVVTITEPPLTPNTCLTAYALTAGVFRDFALTSIDVFWFDFTGIPGHTYNVTLVALDNTTSLDVLTGPCAGPTFVGSGNAIPGFDLVFPVTIVAGTHVILEVTESVVAGPINARIKFDP